MFNRKYYERLAAGFHKADKNFNAGKFLADVTAGMEELSLNGRMRQTSVVLKKHLSSNYKQALTTMFSVIPEMPRGYTNLLFPDYVGLYGQGHFDLSMEALKYFTTFGSSEFAIREFLKRDFRRTILFMEQWARDKDHHVRRLASEGSRPRLPWSFKLDQMISDPSHSLKILDALKEDSELYVRKSVANHLNDISKDNPDFMLKLVGGWSKTHPHTSWIVKHASRSLIKKGHAGSLAVFGFEKNIKVAVKDFKVGPARLKLGEVLRISFDLVSKKAVDQKLVVDYVIHYRKKSGELSPKVFKLTELKLRPKETVPVSKKQVIKDFTTRKHEAGIHIVEIQVNGKILERKEFYLHT